MIWELWETEDGSETSFFPADHLQGRYEAARGKWRLVFTVDAPGLNAAVAEMNARLGRDPQQPMHRPDGSPYPEDEVHDGYRCQCDSMPDFPGQPLADVSAVASSVEAVASADESIHRCVLCGQVWEDRQGPEPGLFKRTGDER